MHVSTPVRRSLALLVVLAAASACSDATSAPRAGTRPAFDIEALQPEANRGGGNWNGQGDRDATDDNVTTLTIDPHVSRTYTFGQNWISFPAHSICDPATSGYGPSLWESTCTPIRRPIAVTVHWSSRGGFAYARFTPELRFVPADAGTTSRWVILSLHAQKRLKPSDVYSILYNGTGTTGWIDESISDPTLRAWLDPLRNSIVRRVKHFSGYMVAAAYDGIGGMSDASY